MLREKDVHLVGKEARPVRLFEVSSSEGMDSGWVGGREGRRLSPPVDGEGRVPPAHLHLPSGRLPLRHLPGSAAADRFQQAAPAARSGLAFEAATRR